LIDIKRSMNSDIFFRLANVLILGGFTCIRAPYIWQSIKQAANPEDRKRSIIYTAISIVMVLVGFYYLYSPGAFYTFAVPFPDVIKYAGVMIGLAGNVLLLWTHKALDKNFAMYVTSTKNHKLVTSGPYAIVRHPMYTAFIMIAAGFFLVSSNLFFGAFVAVMIYPLIYRMNIEESYLSETFGETYRKYMAETKRLLPYIY